jgi:hypothetical protein
MRDPDYARALRRASREVHLSGARSSSTNAAAASHCAFDASCSLPCWNRNRKMRVRSRICLAEGPGSPPQLRWGWRRAHLAEIHPVEPSRGVGDQSDRQGVYDEPLPVGHASGETKPSGTQHRPSHCRQEGEEPLAMRRFPASSVGPGYRSVWLRDPHGRWTFFQDIAPDRACTRYFGAAVDEVVDATIDINWSAPRKFSITVVGGGHRLAWHVTLTSSMATG